MNEKSTANCRQKSVPNRRKTEKQSTRGVEARKAPRRQQANAHSAPGARLTTVGKIEEMASAVKRRCDGTQNFLRAETVSVALQRSDTCRSRDECVHGRTQFRARATEDHTPQEKSCTIVGTVKKMMINGSILHEEVQLRPNDLQEVLRKAASEGCEATQEEVRSHKPVQEAVEFAMFIQLVLHEEMKDQWQSDAAARKKHREPGDEVQEPRGNTC